ncbi:hypothetical protein BGX38DRAFT_1171273, partial [Terfezia claveryi]
GPILLTIAVPTRTAMLSTVSSGCKRGICATYSQYIALANVCLDIMGRWDYLMQVIQQTRRTLKFEFVVRMRGCKMGGVE